LKKRPNFVEEKGKKKEEKKADNLYNIKLYFLNFYYYNMP
jgi:hypothetical protein